MRAAPALLCALLWSGAFEVEVPGPQFSGGQREVRVELCTRANEPRVVVSERMLLTRADGAQQAAAWHEVKEMRLYVVAVPPTSASPKEDHGP